MMLRPVPVRPRRPGSCLALGCAAKSRRSGAAIVEFAVMAPLLFLLILGMIEFGRAFMVIELLNNAARNAARVGVLDGSDNTAVTTAVNDSLNGSSVSGASTTIQVNGTTADVSTAQPGDIVSVNVTIPYRKVTWLPTNTFLGNAILGGRVAMRREG